MASPAGPSSELKGVGMHGLFNLRKLYQRQS